MLTKDQILNIAKAKGKIRTSDIVEAFDVSRQYASGLISELVSEKKLIKIGSTRKAFYVLTQYASKHLDIFPSTIERRLKNVDLEEHKVLDDIESNFPGLLKLPENVRSIFTYAFSEMLNNAIEHSQSTSITVEAGIKDKQLHFVVNDVGIGVFRNIMQKKNLRSELEAIQDLLKGKTTTMPKSHSGEGIFFTSKVSDLFILESFENQLIFNNKINDIFLKKPKRSKTGTRVFFSIDVSTEKHLGDIFRAYTDYDEQTGLPAFDKTEIKVKLYTIGGIHVSRSQARRALVNLEKFKSIVFDFDKVPMIGQAFADEIFRVFHNKHPEIKLKAINMNEAVKFMVDRVEGNNPRNPDVLGSNY